MIKKKDLLHQGGPRQSQLVALAREIMDRETVLEAMKEKTLSAANAWITEVCLQGEALMRAKAMLTHGMWGEWLRIHCAGISQRTASNYMRVASNWQHVADLDHATSLRAALALCTESGDPVGKATKSWPPYVEALGRVGKFTDMLAKNPLSDWPAEGLDKLREDLEPVARSLWPERFEGEEEARTYEGKPPVRAAGRSA